MTAVDPEAYVATVEEVLPVAAASDGRPLVPSPQSAGAVARPPLPAAAARQVSVRRQVFVLAWPAVLEQLLLAMVGLVDAFIVGHLGPAAITGVGLGGQATILAIAAFTGLGVGSTALIARHSGAGDTDEVQKLAWQSLLGSALVGLMVGALSITFAEPLMRFFDASSPEVVAEGALWLRVYSLSLPMLAVLAIGNAIMRGSGNTRTPLIVMIAVNVLNLGIGWVLVNDFNYGIVGSAIGTMVGQNVGGAIVAYLLWRGHRGIRLAGRLRGLDWSRIRRIFNVGTPAAIEQLLLQLALMALNFIITSFSVGPEPFAAHMITWRISGMAYLPGFGFAVAATTLVGQELGRRNPQRAMRSGYEAFGLALAIMAVCGVPMYFLARPLAGTMINDPEVLRIADVTLRIAALAQIPLAGSFVFAGALRGAGDTRVTSVISVISIVAVRLTVAYGLGVVLGMGLAGVWWSIFADFSVRGLLYWQRFRRGKWQTIRV